MSTASLRHFLQLRDEGPKFSCFVVCGVLIAVNYTAAQKVVFVFMGGIVARTVECGGHARSGPETETDRACQQWHEVVSVSLRK